MLGEQLEELLKQIQRNPNLPIEEIKELLKPLILNINFQSLCFYPDAVFVFRGRKLDDEFTKKDALLLKNLSYIPKEKKEIAKRGRANREGFPIFYCSDGGGPSTVFWETKCSQAGDEIIVTSWKPKKILPLSNVADFPHGLNKLENTDIERVLRKLFVDEGDYDVSIAITEILTEGDWNLELDGKPMEESRPCGIRYPSVAKKGYGANCVILPEYVDSHMDFVAAQHLKVMEVSSEEVISVKILDFADSVKNKELAWWGFDSLKSHNSLFCHECVEERSGASKYGFAECGPDNRVYHHVIVGGGEERICIGRVLNHAANHRQ